KWTTRGKNPEHAGQFFTRYTFGDDRHPVVLDELRIRLPKTRTLKHAPVGGKLEPVVSEEGDNRLYHWKVTHRQQLPQDENLPSQVVTNRYSDCKDQTQLLAVMLREAGVPVALATLGTLDEGQVLEAVPSPWGTHAILLVTLDGKEHWIDTTVSLAGWDHLP